MLWVGILEANDRCASDRFEDIIFSSRIVLFLKGRASFPLCGLSGDVCSMLKKNKINFKDINLLENPELHLFLKEKYVLISAPYLFVQGNFIGGYEEIRLLFEREKLIDTVC
jgi:monothiol glutaredoxin